MDILEFHQRKDGTYFVQESCDYVTLSCPEGITPPHLSSDIPICKYTVSSYNIMSRSTFHLGPIADLLIRWNTDYLTSLIRQGANQAQVEGDLKTSVEWIKRLVNDASRVILDKPVCCPICRYRVHSEEAMLDHNCAPLKFGCHLCPCNSTFHSHNDFKSHSLPNSLWLGKIESESEDGKSFGVINWKMICGLALVQLLLTTAENDKQRFSFRCVCSSRGDNKFSNFIHYVAHLSLCKEYETIGCRTCGFCYWPIITDDVANSYHDFLRNRIDVAVPLSGNFKWADFHTFFVTFKDIHRFEPMRIFTENGIFQSIIESEFDAKDFVFGNLNEEACRTYILKHIKQNLNKFNDHVTCYPNVCSGCFCRLKPGLSTCDNGDTCSKAANLMHRCKCGKIFDNHPEYWAHIISECRFQVGMHLVLFALMQKKTGLTCACETSFGLNDLYAFLRHWERCPPMIEDMANNCHFCRGESADSTSTLQYIQQFVASMQSTAILPDFYVLGISGYTLDDVVSNASAMESTDILMSSPDPSVTPPVYMQNMKLFEGPVMTTVSKESQTVEEKMDDF